MPTSFLQGVLAQHLPPLRLVSRASQEYAGACPFCGGDHRRSDRFHVWLMPAGRERYWCRRCNRKGLAKELLGSSHGSKHNQPNISADARTAGPTPQSAHIPFYRQLYALVTAWAVANLHQPWNPEPLAYLHRRGFDLATVHRARLGYALNDPQTLVDHICQHAPTLLPYAEEAGLLLRDGAGALRTHWNITGRIVIPYTSDGKVYDLRTRRFPGKGYTSLPGNYARRGATSPFGWDDLASSNVVIITEGEFKALAVNAAYRAGALPYPAMSHPGLSYFRPEWATALSHRGVRVVILAYDARATRPHDDNGHEQLAPEETWTIRHGGTLATAGLQVLVLNLPIAPGAEKEDLDGFLLHHGPAALAWQINTTVRPLHAYVAQLPPALIRAAGIDRHRFTA